MQGFLIWGAFTVAVAGFCCWKPRAARIFVGLFFAVMALGIHGGMIATDPQAYVDFADSAPWGSYRDVILAAGIAYLLTKHFPTDAWSMLRRRHPGRDAQPVPSTR